MNIDIKRSLFYGISLLFLTLFSFDAFAQMKVEKQLQWDETTRRKFDYYFYEAMNAKTLNKFDEAFDFLQHCHSLDSTNANMLVELGAYYNSIDENSVALDFFRKAVQYDPQNYYYNMILAGMSKEFSLNQEVVDIYENLLKIYPDKTDLYYELANAYSINGELDKAIDTLDKLEKIIGISDAVTLNKFRLYNMLDKKKKAFEEVQQIIDKNPSDPRYLILMGDLYMQDEQYQKALGYYEKTRQIDPDYPPLTLATVGYYEKTGNKQAAEVELTKAIVSPKMDVEMKMQLLTRYIAILQQNKRDIKVANQLFQTLFEQYPNNTELNLIFGNVLLLQNDKNAAMRQFETYTQANPANPVGYEQMLRVALPDSLNKVIEITSEAIKNIPDAAQFYFYNGAAKYQKEEYEAALNIFEKGLENAVIENPLIEADFYGQIGDLHYRLGDKKSAFENYDKSLVLNPQNLPVLNNYSYYLSLENKNLDKAEQMSGITIKAEPTNATYLDTYGWILFKQGAYVMAKIYIQNAIRYSENEPSADVHEHYGDVLAVTGETDKAVEEWLKAKELGSDSKTLDKKIEKREYIAE